MLAAQQSGKLHHAWLLTGPRGIGKATLAWRFARFLLAGQAGRPVRRAPDTLDVAREAPGRALVDARSHPDLFHLRRTLNPKTPAASGTRSRSTTCAASASSCT